MGCCGSTPRVDPGQQDNGFQSMGPRLVEVPAPAHQEASSHAPNQGSERLNNPNHPPSNEHAVSSPPVIIAPSAALVDDAISPGTTTPAVKTDAGESHATQGAGEGTSLEPVVESPPEPEAKRRDGSKSSSSSSVSSKKS